MIDREPMKTVILSAGQGRRLLPYTENKPKCLVDAAGFPILGWQLRALEQAGVTEAVVVTGFQADAVETFIAGYGSGGISVRTSFNPFFQVADNLGSLFTVRHELAGGCMILNGDTLFEPDIARRLLADARSPVTVTTNRKPHYDDDDMKVELAGDAVRAVGKTLSADRTHAESIGMILLDAAGADALGQTMERILREPDGTGKWYLSAIDRLAGSTPGLVGSVSIEGLAWGEVDCPADLNEMRPNSTLFSWYRAEAATTVASSATRL
mgnify:CR=1 FL=1